MTTIQAVILDLDDTLYAERDYTFSGYRAVADAFTSRLGAAFDLFERMRILFDSPDRSRVFNVILAEAAAENAEGLVTEMIDTFRTHRPTIALFPDADAALTRLRSSHRLGIISDGFLESQEQKVRALGLSARVDEIVLTDAWGRDFWKPHPRAFEDMAHRLDADPAACVYVGDNRAKDFVSPNALGWRTVYIDRPQGVHRAKAAPPGGDPQFTLTTLDKLDDVLRATP